VRILHVGKYYAPQRGGMERHIQDLAQWQVSHGIDVEVLVHQPGGRWRTSRECIDGVKLTRVGCLATPLYAPLSPTFPLQFARALRSAQPDLLHLHLPNPSCFAALASAPARRLPWIVHWQAEVSPEVPDWRLRLAYRAYRPFEQALLAHAAAIICTSQAYLDASPALARWHAKARVIPLGIDAGTGVGTRAPEWPRPDTLKLLAVGRLSHYKGFATLIDALAQVPEASLVLIGDGEESTRLRDQAQRRGVSARINFAGATDDATVNAAYAAADAFVLPSLDRSESFGLVLLEAMRARLPVIASAIPGSGVNHVLAEGAAGLLVERGDAVALGLAIRRIANDRSLRETLGAAGRQRWEEHFTLERSARAVLALYLQTLGTHAPAAAQAD